MTAPRSRQSLGRGLDALFGDVAEEPLVGGVGEPPAPAKGVDRGLSHLPIEKLFPSSFQPRRVFNEKQLDELAASIRDKGVLQPLLVRAGEGGYEIIAGERRWRASQRARIHEVPVIIKDFNDCSCEQECHQNVLR